MLRHVEPEASRVVMVPSGITFLRLHDVIQFVMGWQDYHLHEFSFEGMKETFTNSDEQVDEYRYYRDNPVAEEPEHQRWVDIGLQHPCRLTSKVKIDKYLQKYGRALYTYDFGDGWEHDVIVEAVIEDFTEPHPVCLEWKGLCPPEDVGGPPGYEDFLSAWKRPSNLERRELVSWGKGQGYTGKAIDLDELNFLLSLGLVLKRPRRPKVTEVGEEG